MDQLASAIFSLGLILFGVLFLLLSLRSQVRRLKQQVESLTSLANKLEGRTQALEDQTALSEKPPMKSVPKVKKASAGSKPQASVEPKARQKTPKSPEPSDIQKQPQGIEIITRTTKQDGQSLDTWTSEREWSGDELRALLAAQESGQTSSEMAVQLGVDRKDVVYAIARHVFKCEGNLEDLEAAPNHGKKWLNKDDETMKSLLVQGFGVSEVSFRLGRTQLAIIWRLLG